MPDEQRSTWWNRRAIGLHVTLAVCFPGFLALGWWQLQRALGGNALSWAYTFEWPFFAAYAAYLWWRLLHEPPDAEVPAGAGRRRPGKGARRREDRLQRESAQLATYNAYLAALHEADRPSSDPVESSTAPVPARAQKTPKRMSEANPKATE